MKGETRRLAARAPGGRVRGPSARAGALIVAWLTLAAVAAHAEAAPGSSAPERVPIGQRIAHALRRVGWPDEAIIVAISTLPIVELRGAIPAGYVLRGYRPDGSTSAGSTPRVREALWIYFLAVLGNMLPVPFLLVGLGPLSAVLMRHRFGKAFFEWLFARTRRKAAGIEKYETLGLAIFVAIPLPATGAWTGAIAAFLMGLAFHHALLSILLGVMIAGVIVTALSLAGWWGATLAGAVLVALGCKALAGWLRKEEAIGPAKA